MRDAGDSETAAAMFAALANPARIELLRIVQEAGLKGIRSGEVAERAGMPLSSTSSQLGILKAAGLVSGRRSGRTICYTADGAALDCALDDLRNRLGLYDRQSSAREKWHLARSDRNAGHVIAERVFLDTCAELDGSNVWGALPSNPRTSISFRKEVEDIRTDPARPRKTSMRQD